jgi:hypothetical protein
MKELVIDLIEVQVTYLQLHRQDCRRWDLTPGMSFKLLTKPIDEELYKSYYQLAGSDYHWIDRIVLHKDELSEIINRNDSQTIIMQV